MIPAEDILKILRELRGSALRQAFDCWWGDPANKRRSEIISSLPFWVPGDWGGWQPMKRFIMPAPTSFREHPCGGEYGWPQHLWNSCSTNAAVTMPTPTCWWTPLCGTTRPRSSFRMNWLCSYLPESAVIADITADDYDTTVEPIQVKAIEGIPTGNLRSNPVFMPDDPAWGQDPGGGSLLTHRRPVISCYSWPGVLTPWGV
jgi:hypothetical protein